MKIPEEVTYERARRLANNAMWTVALQCRRLQTDEPEDKEFIFRRWADFHFLIVALMRLRRSAVLASKIKTIEVEIKAVIAEFDLAMPGLKTMRDIEEHIDEYAIDSGRNKHIARQSLEVSTINGLRFEWLGHSLDAFDAMQAGQKLFDSIKACELKI